MWLNLHEYVHRMRKITENNFHLGCIRVLNYIIYHVYSFCTFSTLGTKQGSWILGGGWNNDLWGGDLPAASWINDVTPNNPVSPLLMFFAFRKSSFAAI